ncbi:MAG: hypothetical protein RLZ98_806 [Pseudomonadota bacterium]|jgi:taurine dioxygenase
MATATEAVPFDLKKLTPAIGAEIRGVDLSSDVSDALVAAIEQALLDNLVLVIRDQKLSPPDQIAFTSRYGELVRRIKGDFLHPVYPDVLVLSNRMEKGKPVGATTEYAGFTWHADLTYAERPSMGSMLHALEVPEEGGDTAWCNMYLAYETLPEATRSKIDNLNAIHERDRRKNPRAGLTDNFNLDVNAYYDLNIPPRLHPMVRTHPKTGRKALFVSPRFTIGIHNMPDSEAQPLLDELFEHQRKPEFMYRHKWRLGDLVFWDNRCTIHLACGGIKEPGIRHLHRTSIAGDVPY